MLSKHTFVHTNKNNLLTITTLSFLFLLFEKSRKRREENIFMFYRYRYQIILFLIVAVLFIANYKPGTFLTGWDTLHPEFDFFLNFKRLISGVWREEQGLGAVAGHSHMADLPRVFILWIFSFFTPLFALRYLYVFLCLLAGPLGIYTLIHTRFSRLVSFLSALFYLFSLGALQQFYTPLEMFTTQYAALPWIVLFSLQLLEHPNKKSLLLYALITLFAAPQAYAAHLWYAFFAVYTLFLLYYSYIQKNTWIFVKRSTILIAITLFMNAFWLLPNIYFIATSSNVPKESKQNRIFSQEYRLRNQENGYLQDVALIKGFYFNWPLYDFKNEKITNLMPEWNTHLASPFIAVIGYGLFSCVIYGLILAVKRKDKHFLPFLPFFIVPFIFLMNHTPPFEWFFNALLRIPLFEEALRFVFTKFSILLLFSYTMFFSFFLARLFAIFKKPVLVGCFVFIIAGSLALYSFPMFQGFLISPAMKVSIPQEYFDFWNSMKNEPDGTVLSLPLHTFTGWQYYNWGYQGSGFLWFGLKQPLLDRDSDRWSIPNEQAFREFHYALYARNVLYFEKNLEKFNISYLVWDTHNISVSAQNENQIVYEREIHDLLNHLIQNNVIRKIGTFGGISVYKTSKQKFPGAIYENLPRITPSYRWTHADFAFMQFGAYQELKGDNNSAVVFPYRDSILSSDRMKQEFFYRMKKMQDTKNLFWFKARAILDNQTFKEGIVLDENIFDEIITFRSQNNQNGINLLLDTVPHTQGYILVFHSKNIKGLPLRFCLKNMYSNICDIYDELKKATEFDLDYFYIPKREEGIGYELGIDNISFGNYESVNQLKEVLLIPVSEEIFSEYRNQNASDTTDVTRIFALNTSFHEGWKAYSVKRETYNVKRIINQLFPFVFGTELKKHVLVNNWANGWKTTCNAERVTCSVVTIFLPQYLEYIGFFILGLTLACVILFLCNSPTFRCEIRKTMKRR